MSSISKVSSSSASAAVGPQDKEIQALMKQKMQINEEIKNVNENKNLDSKQKMERIQTLTENIAQIDAQISQLKVEKLKEKVNSAHTEPASNPSKETSPSGLDSVVISSVAHEQLKTMHGLSNKLEGSIKALEKEVRIDRVMLESGSSDDNGRSLMLENAENTVYKMKREMNQKTQSHLDQVNERVGKLAASISDRAQQDKDESTPSVQTSAEDEITDSSQKSKDKSSSSTEETASAAVTTSAPAAASIDIRV
jgi:hypothetical protein